MGLLLLESFSSQLSRVIKTSMDTWVLLLHRVKLPQCRHSVLFREASSLGGPVLIRALSPRVTVDCMDPTCSSRGVCVRGECHCSVGWGGASCETPRATCLDQCSGHGTFLPDTGLCSCDPSWTGHDCSIGRCGESKGAVWTGSGRFHCDLCAFQSCSGPSS